MISPVPFLLIETIFNLFNAVQSVSPQMLMLKQVNGSSSILYHTAIKHSTVHTMQVEYDDSLVRQICVFVK